MSFREVLEGYMKDRNEDSDIIFMEQIVSEHEQEIENAKSEGSSEMEKTWKDEIDMFIEANRDVTELMERLNILQSFLPKIPSYEELKQAIIDSGYEPKLQNMKHIMSYVKDKYPAADGGKVIEIIKQIN